VSVLNENKVISLIQLKNKPLEWEQKEIIYSNDKEPTGKELREMVGGWLEMVNVIYEGRQCQAIINEEGKLNNLPVNYEATSMYHSYLHENGYHVDDVIVGNIAIMTNFELE
jgi:hypothetical protein